ncbi:DUF2795 domain-containing protein [Streptomyces lunaelactis]|uniref:DUF2795 domain-containing protein n=2 Tax=Streptomyces lunaelactis TaxID=1535768 RepID=UPI0015858954|nr:DUF2795 domain-containing protein [Streptomyces lunaelactis]NUK26727.1 DUF2795 domain-containing protein [Streptomyces lunaelactis]NUK50075.1 DUF2795 domain-containing protein [Streptomyces lunaelactis]NUK64301.1 DUF2795 domain-containing protein [Streptomyces lunaelactis]NUK77927.1 DUF2795 domain-containing protein [Streptomyces lunaelactis]
MQRGSDRLSVRKDDEMKHELQGLLRSGHPTRVKEWQDPEPGADDDPEIVSGAAPERGSVGPDAKLEVELARHLSRTAFPATRGELADALSERHASDRLVELVNRLPAQEEYHSAHEVVSTLARQA